MSLMDPISDMVTRIRNAHRVDLDVVDMPSSRLKSEIARVLKREGFITDYTVEGGTKQQLRIYLKYTGERDPAIRGMKRVSKPGLRKYVGAKDIPRVLGGLGFAILTTSQGVLTDREARERQVGGEVLCSIW